MTLVEEVASEGHTVHFDLQMSVDKSVMVNSILAKWLCQAILLLTDRERRKKWSVVEIFLIFYPTIIGVSFFFLIRLILCLQLIHDMSDLEVGYTKFDDIRSAWKNKVIAANAEKAAALEQLKSTVEREAKLQEEVFRLTDDLASLRAELESAHETISALES